MLKTIFLLVLVFCLAGCRSTTLGQPTGQALAASPTPPLPTLVVPAPVTPDQAQLLVSRLLRDNASCPQICFWGVRPGASNGQQSAAFLNSLGTPLLVHSQEGIQDYQVNLVTAEKIQVQTTYRVAGPELRQLQAKITGLDQANVAGQSWQAFRPETILANYGRPDLIGFTISKLANDRYAYRILFSYTSLKFTVEYVSVPFQQLAPFCPLIEHNLQEVDVSYGDTYRAPYPPYQPVRSLLSLPEASFLAIFQKKPADACFDYHPQLDFPLKEPPPPMYR